MTINPYEIELKVTNTNTREEKLVTRREYAYSAADAVQQAVLNQSAVSGSADIRLVKIGPPAELVRATTAKMADELMRTVRTMMEARAKT